MKRFLTALLAGTLLTLAVSTSSFGHGDPRTSPLRIGDYAWGKPGPSLPALDGASYPLAHWKGKVVVLNFWATWCGPCQYEIPELVRLQQEHGPDGLQIIGIGVDQERPLRNVSRSLGINYPVLVAEDATGSELLAHWGNPGRTVPYNVVIGQDGRILHAWQGQLDQELFNEYVAPLLNRSQPQQARAVQSEPDAS